MAGCTGFVWNEDACDLVIGTFLTDDNAAVTDDNPRVNVGKLSEFCGQKFSNDIVQVSSFDIELPGSASAMKEIISSIMNYEEQNGSEQPAGVWRFRYDEPAGLFYSVINYYESEGHNLTPVTKTFIRQKPGTHGPGRKRRASVNQNVPNLLIESDVEVGNIGETQTQTNIVSRSGHVKGSCDSDNVCKCIDGYRTGGDMECNDINECSEDTEICGGDVAGFCFNNAGAYDCECNEGFYFNNKTCSDIDECKLDSTLCSEKGQECLNTYGSFSCDCATGFVSVIMLVDLAPIAKCVWPEWSEWTEWTNDCNVDVEAGVRQRACSVPLPNDGCPGEEFERRECSQLVKQTLKLCPGVRD